MSFFRYDDYLLLAAAFIFALELAAGAHRGVYRKEDILVTIACQLLGTQVTRPVAALLVAGTFSLLLPAYRGALSGIQLLPATLCLLAVTDGAFYWGHRLAHAAANTRFEWLWKLHRTHHAGKYMNVTLTARVHPLWSFVVPTTWVLGLAAYLGQARAAAVVLLVTFGWNLLTHSHFRWDDVLRQHRLTRRAMAVLDHIIITPGIHHTHHGFGRDGANYRNYAVMFSWIDWTFGTLHIPRGRPARYGLPGSQPHWAEELLYPLVRIKSRREPG